MRTNIDIDDDLMAQALRASGKSTKKDAVETAMQGFRTQSAFTKALNSLSAFAISDSVGEQLAITSAQNYRRLRDKGITIRTTVDCLIATFCITHGHSLLHRDRDFDAFVAHLGLSVVHPSIH